MVEKSPCISDDIVVVVVIVVERPADILDDEVPKECVCEMLSVLALFADSPILTPNAWP